MTGIFYILLGLGFWVGCRISGSMEKIHSDFLVHGFYISGLDIGEVVTNFILVQVNIGIRPVDFATDLMQALTRNKYTHTKLPEVFIYNVLNI